MFTLHIQLPVLTAIGTFTVFYFYSFARNTALSTVKKDSFIFQDCDDLSETSTDHEYCLVLRRWMEINPAFEFRCFVRNKELIGGFDTSIIVAVGVIVLLVPPSITLT